MVFSKTGESGAEVMAVFKDCGQRLPKVVRFCGGCSSGWWSKTAQSFAEVMAVFADGHQRLPKVLLK